MTQPLLQTISIPDWLGGGARTGVELGPLVLERSLLSGGLASRFAPPRRVDVPTPSQSMRNLRLRFLPEMVQLCRDAKAAVTATYETSRVPLALVGNDSAMIGVLSGAALRRPGLGVLWCDAHGDLNTPETSPSGLIYGMPLRHLLGHGHPDLCALNPGRSSLEPGHLALIGTRALDPGEASFIRKEQIPAYSPEQLADLGPAEAAQRVIAGLCDGGCTQLFIHVDLDVLDPEESPGVTLPEPVGVRSRDLRDLLDAVLASSVEIVGLSISEYNPSRDIENTTRDIALGIAEMFTEGVSCRPTTRCG